MKKCYSLSIAVFIAAFTAQAQTHTLESFVQTVQTNRLIEAEHSNQRTEPAAPTTQYFNDIIVDNQPTFDEQRVRLSVAFNGWLYAAFTTVDTINQTGGITIRMSRDNGQTWTTIEEYHIQNTLYPTFDIVVTGTDTNNLILFNAGVNNNLSSGSYTLFIDRYNATNGSFIGNNYSYYSTNKLYDVALASDYRFPAVNTSPYGVGLLYSAFGPVSDSIVYIGSLDAGSNWPVRHTVATTFAYHRNVSLAYGRSASASNGRYFAAWEQRPSSFSQYGNIYTSRNQSTVDGPWINKINLDSISPTAIGFCNNPQIAVQFNTIDNDSAGPTAIVLVQRDYTTDRDVIGFYNKRSHFTNNWYRLDVSNTGNNDLQPDITYDPGANNFLTTYYDSTNGKLPYVVNGMNILNPNTWILVSSQYNDNTANLRNAWPRVEINPVTVQAAHVWIAGTGNGIAMFDAEYLVAGVNENTAATTMNLYPNPASSNFAITFDTHSAEPATINVYNIMGEIVFTQQITYSSHGAGNAQINTDEWANGMYTVSIVCNGHTTSSRLVVSHQ
jgi:Secretion system C-terminal sorting domain